MTSSEYFIPNQKQNFFSHFNDVTEQKLNQIIYIHHHKLQYFNKLKYKLVFNMGKANFLPLLQLVFL